MSSQQRRCPIKAKLRWCLGSLEAKIMSLNPSRFVMEDRRSWAPCWKCSRDGSGWMLSTKVASGTND